MVVDLLLLSHSLIFVLSNYLGGEEKYELALGQIGHDGSSQESLVSRILPYKVLLPLLLVQVRLRLSR